MIKIFNCDCFDFFKSKEFLELTKNKNCIIVTDPPFNINYHYNKYKDNLKESEYIEKLSSLLTMHNMPFVVIHYPETLYRISYETGFFPRKIISWCYNSNTAKQHRDIAFFKVSPNMNQMKQPYKNPNDKRIKERIKNGSGGARLYDWWEINQVKNVYKNKQNITHPCIMPVEVMKRIVGILPKDALIIDPFSGSGTTGIACKILGYDFIGCELDEVYYNESLKRIESEVI